MVLPSTKLPPHSMQLWLMLRLEGVNGNGKQPKGVTLRRYVAGATGQFKVRLGSSLDFLCHLDVVEPRRRQRARMTYRLVH